MIETERTEWLQQRCGKITASRIAEMMATLKGGGESASRRNYRAELVCERLTGIPTLSYVNFDMQRGIELEPIARTEYELERDVTIEEAGFIRHPTLSYAGASPDGFVGDEGLVEFKCPKTANHLDYLLAGGVPSEYNLQMQWQMAVTGRQWCDFVSYEPNLPPHLQKFIVRCHRDEPLITKITAEVVKFEGEIQALIAKLPQAEPACVEG